MADAMKSPTYEEVVEQKKALEVFDDGQPKPDMPVTIAAPVYGDPGHVNPALNPAPLWTPPPERVTVPVQNDPGVLGSSPSLGDLNRSYRADDMERGGSRARVAVAEPKKGSRPDIDDTMGITEENNQEEVRQAAEDRMKRIQEGQKKAEKDASTRGRPVPAASSARPSEASSQADHAKKHR